MNVYTFDVFCHCNPLGETFGNTVAEAMMHGKPVVSHLGKRSWPQAQIELLASYNYYVCASVAGVYCERMHKLYAIRS